MFEHSMMTRKLKQRLNKVISVTMSVAMLVGTLPADLLGGFASVQAAGTSTILNVSDLAASEIKQDTVLGDTIFTAKADASHVLTVAADAQTIDDKAFTKSLKLVPGAAITFDAAGAGDLKMYLMASESGTNDGGDTGDDPAGSEGANGAAAADIKLSVQKTGGDAASYSVSEEGTVATHAVAEAGTYTLTAEGGAVKVFYLEFAAKGDSNVKTYVLDASGMENGAADNEPIPDGTKLGTEDYFEVVLGTFDDNGTITPGTVLKRNGSGTLKGLEINKNGGAAITFTVQGTADVELQMSSTGGSNDSVVALLDASGKIVAFESATASNGTAIEARTDGTVLVHGNQTTPSTLVYKGLKAGTYSIVSPEDTIYDEKPLSRAAWLIKATVEETPAASTVETKHYELDASGMENGAADNEPIPDGTKLGDEDYFEVVLGTFDDNGTITAGTVLKRNGSGTLKGLEINKNGGASINFTVTGTADVELQMSSTGGSNDSVVALLDASGKIVAFESATASNGTAIEARTDGTVLVHGNQTTPSTLVYKGLKAGTYSIVSPEDTIYDEKPLSRAAWLIKATVDETITTGAAETKDYVLDASAMENGAADNEPIPDGTKLGDEDYFEVVLGTFDDNGTITAGTVLKRNGSGTLKGLEINKNGGASINFTVQGTADVELQMSSTGGSNDSVVALLDASGKIVAFESATASNGTAIEARTDGTVLVHGNQTTPSTLVYKGLKAGTYSIVSPEDTIYDEKPLSRAAWLIKATVSDTFGGSTGSQDPTERTPWEDVEAPVIKEVKLNSKNAKEIQVLVTALIGTNGADEVTVTMYDDKGTELNTLSDTVRATVDKTFAFTPSGTGEYSFIARTTRKDESEVKLSAEEKFSFELPLDKPTITGVANKGLDSNKETASIEVVWAQTAETRGYEITVTDKDTGEEVGSDETTKTSTKISDLKVGSTVIVSVVSVGIYKDADGKDYKRSEPATSDPVLVTGEYEDTWLFSAWGSSISNKTNGYEISKDGTKVTVYSESGAGKIVPGSTDGLAFYYTAVDPSKNFILNADVHVDGWTYSNGQDGFGMMVSDAVGTPWDGNAFWNNSYQLVATKIEYRWDKVNNKVTDVVDLDTTERYSMRLGLGWIAKEGVTATDVAKINLGEQTMPNVFSSTSGTLDTTAANGLPGSPLKGADYNMVANNNGGLVNSQGVVTIESIANVEDFKLQIRRNNTGYVLTYFGNEEVEVTDADGNVTKEYPVIGRQVFYDDARNSLTQIDKRNIYAGFFAARNARITVSDISMQLIDPDDDDPAEEREITYVDPDFQLTSSVTSNSTYYELIARANMDGRLTIVNTDTNEVVAQGEEVAANQKYIAGLTLTPGENHFQAKFVPNEGYVPGEYQKMTSLDPIVRDLTVTYIVLDGTYIYVHPDGKTLAEGGLGTEQSPLDIQTAVAYAKPGQTIYLMEGTYYPSLDKEGKPKVTNTKADLLLIDRGHSGTAKQPIHMEPAPGVTKRPVIDFEGQSSADTAFTIVGDYWYLKGFDVTNSKNGQKGIQVSGDHNVLEEINTYLNGNTGLQIARYQSDGRADWPAYNTILNCTSFLNADGGYEDADGFACKLTAGEGNKFIGCIAAYNADDGWDLFAKVETGSIGSVTIENCLAFKNGYVLTADGVPYTAMTLNGEETDAGNGNGFKMGGDSMSGYHVLKNSIAFGNKAKGIDSNSCPDNQVYNSTSFNNESYNVAFYTNNTPNTDYFAEGILSIKDNKCGTQDDGGKLIAEQLKPQGTQILSKIYKPSNYYVDGTDVTKSYNSNNDLADASWFLDTDMEKAIKGFCEATVNGTPTAIMRDEDGSINMGNFLKLTDAHLGENYTAGAVLGRTSTNDVFVESGEVSVYASTVKTLSQVPKPANLEEAGYDWKYPNTEVSVFAGTATEFIVYVKDNADMPEVPVVVNFIEVTGVEFELDADAKLIGDGELTLKAVPVTAPAVDDVMSVAGGSYTFTFKETSKLGLSIGSESAPGEVPVKRTQSSGNGLAKVNVTMSVTVNGKTVKKQANCTFTTRDIDFDFQYELKGATEDANGIVVYQNDNFSFDGLKVEGVGSNTDVKITGSDSKVIKVTGTSVTAVGEGTATITLTAAADKTVIKNIPVTVRGAAVKANVSTITMDKAKTEGVEITAVVSYDKDESGKALELSNVSVKDVQKGKTSVAAYVPYFTVTNVIGNIYTIQITDAAVDTANHKWNLANGTYNLVLQGTLAGQTEAVEFEPIIVKVTETKPTVSFKQKKVNLFYKAGSTSGYGNLTATSKLAGVTLTQLDKIVTKSEEGSDDVGTVDFRLSATKTGYNVVLLPKAQSKVENRKKLTSQINVRVSFDGYRSYYDKDVKINVATETRAPKLKLDVDNKVLYPQINIKTTDFRIMDTATNTEVIGADVTLASSTNSYINANKNFDLLEVNGIYTIMLKDEKKGGTVKISVQDVDWNQEVVLSQSISVNKSVPKATFAVSKLSGEDKFIGKEQSIALITIKNALDYNLKDFELTGKNKAGDLAKYLDYSIDTNDLGQKVLLLSLKETDDEGNPLPASLRKGSYTLDATFKLNNLETTQTAKVKVTILPTVVATATQKGSIDLVNRIGSSVTVTPNLRNVNGKVVGMTLADDGSNLFNVEWNNAKGVAIVTAKEEIDLKKGGKYKVTPIFDVETENGNVKVAATKPINIVPKQSNLKFTKLTVMEARLSNTSIPARAVMKATSPANAEILEMVQTNNLDNFKVNYDFRSGALNVRIIDAAGLKVGKTYKITLEVNVKDSGVNVKPQKISVPVKVLN